MVATRLKPSRINVENLPSEGNSPTYKTDDVFRWDEGGTELTEYNAGNEIEIIPGQESEQSGTLIEIEGKLKNIIAYGETQQATETYLDTVTLSGGCRQSNLPEGYTQVEYLEVATANVYFSTGINATVDTDMEITTSNITSSSAQILVAQCESGSDYFRIAKAGASQRIIGSFGSSTVTDNNTDGVNKFTARLNKSGFYIDGSLVGTFSNVPSSLTDIGEIDIFRGKYSNTTYFAYVGSRFYSAWVDDNVFLPCRRNSDNQLGIYNIKTGQFILPSGNGTFIAGPDVTTPTPDTPMDIVCNNGAIKVDGQGNIYTQGTVEQVTDSLGNIANAERLLAVGNYTDTQEVISGSVTRNVGIKVLDGTENWTLISGYTNLYYNSGDVPIIENNATGEDVPASYCTHFKGELTTVSGANQVLESIKVGYYNSVTTRQKIYIKSDAFNNNANNLKQFLAQQYANGTPVIVVYPLETATTSTVTGQFLSKSPVTQTAGSISNLPIAITESEKTTPTPSQPLDIICNNGKIGIDSQGNITVTGTTETIEVNSETVATAENLFKIGTYQDVQSIIDGGVTRNVGVKVLDGTENWTEVSSSSAPFALVVDDFKSMNLGGEVLVYSTHFQGVPANATWSNYNSMISFTGSQVAEAKTFRVRYLANTKTLAEFKQFLAEQYANGTPVICVYYKQTTTETVAGQPLNAEGNLTISVTGEINPLTLKVIFDTFLKIGYIGNDVKVSATAPSNPTEGMVWYDTTNDILKTYDGSQWKAEATWGNITGTLSNQTDLQNALNAKANSADLGTASTKDTGTSSGNVPVLDSNGHLATSTLPGVALTDTFTVTNKSDLTSLSNAQQGDIGIVTSESKTYVLATAPYSTLSNWKELLSPTDTVTSVNSKTGAVVLDADDISDTNTTNKFVTANDKSNWNAKVNASDVLTKTNTTSYTPTANYHPATKKYVDDSIVVYNSGKGIKIGYDYSAMQGPAPDGYHVPLSTERQSVYDIWTDLGGGSSDGTNFGIALKLPFAGLRNFSNSSEYYQGTYGRYWSSSPVSSNVSNSHCLRFSLSELLPQDYYYKTHGFSVRCFKDFPVIPNSSWTKLYGTSIEAGGIFWNATDGLISLSSDGQTWITIADKNLGATQVWNSGDTLSEANCGYYYQWGNNYGFPRTGTIANQSTTQVDASAYGPGNYYSSDTFIKYSGGWDSTDNGNLRGGETGVISNAITNTGVISVNGESGHVTIDMSNYLAKDNTTAFIPTGDYNPATKKYVDDGNTVVSGDSGTTYTIKVSNSDPASGTASNIITFVL